MKKNKFSEESRDVLSLGNLHEEIQKEKERKRILIVPFIFLFIGIGLIFSGIFFEDIAKVFMNKEKVEKVDNKGLTILKCNYNSNDETLGLNKKKTIVYTFKSNLLKEVKDTLTVSIMQNSYDIGSNNIKIYKQKYDTLNDIKVDGLAISVKLEKDVLTREVISNFEVLDITKVPESSYFSITNKKDQSYREIKEIEGRAGHICKVSYE